MMDQVIDAAEDNKSPSSVNNREANSLAFTNAEGSSTKIAMEVDEQLKKSDDEVPPAVVSQTWRGEAIPDAALTEMPQDLAEIIIMDVQGLPHSVEV